MKSNNQEISVTQLEKSTVNALLKIVRDYGTPTYAFDIRRMRKQVEYLQAKLPETIGILYSLKANASLGICDVFAQCGIGADVAGEGELATAMAAGFPAEKIFVAGPFKSHETISQLVGVPEALVSIDSISELRFVSESGLRNRLVLRLRPDFGSCAVVPAGCESRFGFVDDELELARDYLADSDLNVIGFHVFAGSQVLDTENCNSHLRRSLELALRAADTLGISPILFNLGGGFGIPYISTDPQLDLTCVGEELEKLVRRAGTARLVLELGRYLVAEAGWYLTSVIGHQTHNGRNAVIVDGGVHQRADMCGLNLRTGADPPLVLDGSLDSQNTPSQLSATDVLGCLSLPDDIMAESSMLPPISTNDVLAFGNAGAYGLWSSPALFHGSPLPAEVAFDEATIHLMRQRPTANSILDNQQHVTDNPLATKLHNKSPEPAYSDKRKIG